MNSREQVIRPVIFIVAMVPPLSRDRCSNTPVGCRTLFPVVSQTIAATPRLSQSKDRPNKGASLKKLASEPYRVIGDVARNSIANGAVVGHFFFLVLFFFHIAIFFFAFSFLFQGFSGIGREDNPCCFQGFQGSSLFRFAIFLVFLCSFLSFSRILRDRQRGKSLFFSGVPRFFRRKKKKKTGLEGQGCTGSPSKILV